jgi:hypothetical protein
VENGRPMRLLSASSVQPRNSPPFIELEGSLPCSRYSPLDRDLKETSSVSVLILYLFKIRFYIIVPSMPSKSDALCIAS